MGEENANTNGQTTEQNQQSGETGQTTESAASKKTYSEDYVKELRDENAKARVKNKELTQSLTELSGKQDGISKAVAAALGLKNGDAATPEALQAQLEKLNGDIKTRDNTIKTYKLNEKLNSQYAKHGVKPDFTRALLRDRGLLDDLDPDDAELDKKLSGSIKKLAEEVPEIKVGQASTQQSSTSTGTDTRGGGGTVPQQLTREDAKRMKPDEVDKAYREGKFDTILGRK